MKRWRRRSPRADGSQSSVPSSSFTVAIRKSRIWTRKDLLCMSGRKGWKPVQVTRDVLDSHRQADGPTFSSGREGSHRLLSEYQLLDAPA